MPPIHARSARRWRWLVRFSSGGAGGDRRVGNIAFAVQKEHPVHGRHRIRHHHHRLRSGRLCDGHPRRPARLQDGDRRARASGRHLPQLGLHSDQGAAAHRRNLPLHETCQGLWPLGRKVGFDPAAVVQRSRACRRPAQQRRRRPAQEEQGARHLGRGEDRQARRGRGDTSTKARHAAADPAAQGHAWRRHLSRPSTSSSPPAHGRARCRASRPTANWCGPISRPWCRRQCRSRCWSWARAPSASSSHPSTMPWAST